MNKSRDERRNAEGMRQTARHEGFQNYIGDARRQPPSDDPLFDELLKRLDDAEEAQSRPKSGGL
ncbi:hypothetical protein [Candidatus Phyllobacterium onerii]|uniref:hypothetical protein n=1 Tax=Candidatus Phyllobacterium onerii TaxID=3020828 RepID=UPI00232F48C7|nr:hypothetical protein [Phyllobacterium sp. IY22]